MERQQCPAIFVEDYENNREAEQALKYASRSFTINQNQRAAAEDNQKSGMLYCHLTDERLPLPGVSNRRRSV